MKKEITFKDVMNFIEGNSNMLLSSMEVKSESYEEQIEYRKSKCQDCISLGKCRHCGCKLPGRFHTTQSCNGGERFPDIMSDEEWSAFKNNMNADKEL